MAASAHVISQLYLQVAPATGAASAWELPALAAIASLEALTDTVAQIEIRPDDNITSDPQTIELQLGTGQIACTVNDAADKIEKTAHGLANGTPVQFDGTALPTGITANTTYYVVSTATNDFQIAATVNGSAITLTGTGTAVKYRVLQSIEPSYAYPTTGPQIPVIIREPGAPLDFRRVRAIQILLRAYDTASNALASVQCTLGDTSDHFAYQNIALKLSFTADGDETWPSALLFLPAGMDYDASWPLTVKIKAGESNTNGIILLNLLGN